MPFGFRGGLGKPRKQFANAPTTLYTPTSQDLHTNAAFTEAEEFAFMMGERIVIGVPARSDWWEAAQWDEKAQTITGWTNKGAQLGPYSGMGEAEARVFAQADSKGGWYWAIIRGRATTGAFPTTPKQRLGKVGVPTPVRAKIIRKPQIQGQFRKWFRW